MNALKCIGKAALNAASSTLNYITPNFVKNKVKGFTSWIRDYVETYRKRPFTATESASALSKFAKKYIIEGRDGYDTHSFLMKIKQAVTDLLRKNSQTKFKIIHRCTMERTDMQSGEVTTNQAAFHSVNELNLAATDLDEL